MAETLRGLNDLQKVGRFKLGDRFSANDRENRIFQITAQFFGVLFRECRLVLDEPLTRQNSTVSACPQTCRPCATICCQSPSHAGTGRRHQKVFAPCRWLWRSAQRHQKVSCWYPPKQSRSVRRKPEKYTSIHLNSKKICSLLVFRRAEMASWYWYLRIYQRFLWVSMWVLGFYWTKREGRNHVFLSDSGLLWTILDFLLVPKGRFELPRGNPH